MRQGKYDSSYDLTVIYDKIYTISLKIMDNNQNLNNQIPQDQQTGSVPQEGANDQQANNVNMQNNQSVANQVPQNNNFSNQVAAQAQPAQPQPQPPVTFSPSPESGPVKVESGGETIASPEVGAETLTNEEKSEQGQRKSKNVKEVIRSNESKPTKKEEFESPFSVYGYKVPQQVVNKGAKNTGNANVKGDTSEAKTWLLVLINRLFRMYKQDKALEASS